MPSSEEVIGRFAELGEDGRPARLGVLGGTFDPIHVGHLRIAEEVREALGLDGVLFIPAGDPVFKKDQSVTDAFERLEQVRCAVADNPRFDVSPIEVLRPGDTYTVDTLRQLRGMLPENVELVFILGDDAAECLGEWKDTAELARLARFAIAEGRPGSLDHEALREKLARAGDFIVDFVPVSALDISSSGIRNRLAQGESIRYLVPEAVRMRLLKAQQVPKGGEEGAAESEEALSDEFFEARRKELEGRVKPKRYRHSLGVSETAGELARRYGVDERKARLAGLLHDWDKGLDDEGIRARVKELSLEDAFDPQVVEHMANVLHGQTAACALGREYPCIPQDVLQAIDRHTVAATDMTPLDMVLYIADAVEPNRRFGRIDELRAAIGKVDLEELFFLTYEYWTYLLLERRKPLHPDTIRIWNSYAPRFGRKKGLSAR